jgi:hypothetical protein
LFVKEGLTPNEIHSKFINVYGDSFADLTKNHYRDGIITLEHCWNKYISLKGDCMENKNNFGIRNSFFHC